MAASLHDEAFPSVKPYFPMVRIFAFAGRRRNLFSGQKQQNQQKTARDLAHNGLRLFGISAARPLGVVVFESANPDLAGKNGKVTLQCVTVGRTTVGLKKLIRA
jgi:hypothetical protein